MRIWRYLAAATPVLLSLSAGAGEPRWYVSAEGGAAQSHFSGTITDFQCPSHLCGFQIPYPVGEEVSGDTETGFAAFGPVGVNFSGPFRIEAEVGHYSNDITHLQNDTNVTTTSVMANAFYDIALDERLSLSLGAGLGVADIDWSTNKGLLVSDESTVAFAIQGIAEVSFDVTDRISVFAKYRYIDVPDPSLSNVGYANDFVLYAAMEASDIQTQTISAGISFDLN